MRITQGKYTLITDGLKNMWIEESFIGKTQLGEDKESTRRVTGFYQDFASLSKDFLKKNVCGNDTQEIEKVLEDLKGAENEIEQIYLRYKEELATLE